MPERNASHISQILSDIGDGDESAAAKLLPLVYDELRAIAGNVMKNERTAHTLQPTALVHEAFLRLVNADEVQWKGRVHFKATAARAMRRLLINHARDRSREKRGGLDRAMMTLDEAIASVEGRDVDLIVLEDALERLAALSPRQAELVELRFFGGLTFEEVAEALSIGLTTAKSDWTIARAWLSREMSNEGKH